ncbi:MAG: DNA gyrase inhibitor YacG [Hyphomicrobium sp.]
MTERSERMNLPKCPVCAAPSDASYRPFCSRRCADVDLGRWLTGGYAIAGAVSDNGGDESDEPSAVKSRE